MNPPKRKGFPPRLHVLIASESPRAVVLARVAKAHCMQFSWDLENDTFIEGQTHPSRIYELRSDVSPDGRLLICLSLSEQTIISEVPTFNPIRQHESHGTWFGGGVWVGNRTYWTHTWQAPGRDYVFKVIRLDEHEIIEARLNSEKPSSFYESEPWREIVGLVRHCFLPNRRDQLFAKSALTGGNWSVYSQRLARDGWRQVTEFREGGYGGHPVHEKELALGWILRKLSNFKGIPKRGRGSDWELHVLVSPDKSEIVYENWEWAEFDEPRSRLLFAEVGKLYATSFGPSGLGDKVLIRDFCSYEVKEEGLSS
jgi:hypothetical protein